MAAPLVATAVKLAAKAMAQKAGSAAASKIRGGGGQPPSNFKMIMACAVILVLLCTASFVSGVSAMVAAHIPSAQVECEIPNVGNEGDTDPANPVPSGTSDGTLGSNIPYPDTDTEKIIWPLENGQSKISSGYGYRAVPAGTADFFGTGTYFHNGLDLAAPLGTPIYAVADGIIAQSAPNNAKSGYGTVVTIHHMVKGKKMTTTYGHILPSVKFKVGDTVKAGQQIASVGSEGNSTGPHLHFVVTQGIYTIQSEINKDPANNIDPLPWLTGNGATQISSGLDDSGNPVPVGDQAGSAETCEQKSESDGTITAWGGHSNGKIPDSELQSLSFASQFRLAKEAAGKLQALNAAYASKFKTNLPIVSAYKSKEDQGGSGTDIAGWAKSIQLEKSVTFESEEYKWLAANSKTHGWMNPVINQSGGNNPLPTRWVYVGDQSTGVEVPGTLSDYQKYAGEKLQSEGFSSPGELGCLIKLWDRESGWRVDADNPSSDAYGIPQSLPGEKMATEGADWKTNYKTQINWGIKYIKDRYGSPCAAWQHSEDFNWY